MVLLITGGLGYIDLICFEELLRQENEVIGGGNLQERRREAIPSGPTFQEGTFGERGL